MSDVLEYLIWSNEHAAWWRPGEMGYTNQLREAGVYTQTRALEICKQATWGWMRNQPPPELPVPKQDAEASLVEADTRLHGAA